MIGQTISHYKILEKLGEGGMGVVYKAEDTRLRRAVALKFLTPEMTRDKEAKNRFIHEAQAASALDHPNIAVVHEIDDTDDGQSFICMAYYDGKTLKELIESGPIEVEQAIRLSIQIADGLHRAHEAGIIHRDIKPANIMITSRGEVKIVDFGVAKLSTQTRGSSTTSTGGTAAYMSPEQAQGIDVDARSDLFSLGVVMYEMVTGKRPFLGEHEAALVYTIVNMDPAPPSSVKTGISREIESIILKLLDKNLTRRYQTAAELRRDLKHLAGLTDSTRKFVVPSKTIVDKRWVILGAVVILVAAFLTFSPTRNLAEGWLGIKVVPSDKLVAVLPFSNIGGDSTNQYFCDGLMEALAAKLSDFRSSKGLYRAISIRDLRERNITTPDRARRIFEATLAITASVQRERDQVRVILNLVDTRSLHQLDSRMIDERSASLFNLQDKAVLALASMLDMKLEGGALRVLAGNTTDPQAYEFYLAGRGYLKDYIKVANIDSAIDLFHRALRSDSTYALAFAALGESYWRKFEATKDVQWVEFATRNSKRALELDDKLAGVHITLGLINAGKGLYEFAITDFHCALALDSLNSDAHRGLARTYELQGSMASAELTLKKAIKMDSLYWAGYTDLGAFYYRQKKYEEALSQWKHWSELTPDNGRAYSSLGAVYSALGRNVEAIEMLERSVAVEPTYPGYNNLAVAYFRDKRYSEQASVFEKALALNDKDYKVWGNLASAYYWSGQKEKALGKFQRAIQMAEEQLKINPRDATVLGQLADYHSMLENKKQALEYLNQSLKIAPDVIDVIRRSADVYEQLGQRERALKQIELALEKGTSFQELERAPALKDLRTDPRYQSLLQKLGKKP